MIDPDYFYKIGVNPIPAAYEYAKSNEDPYSCDLSVEYGPALEGTPLLTEETKILAERIKQAVPQGMYGLEFDNVGFIDRPGIFVTSSQAEDALQVFADILGCPAPALPDPVGCDITYLGMFPNRGQIFRVIQSGSFAAQKAWCAANGIDTTLMGEHGRPFDSDIGYDLVNGEITRVTFTIKVFPDTVHPALSDPWYLACHQRFLSHVESMYDFSQVMIAQDQIKVGLTNDFPPDYLKAYFFIGRIPKIYVPNPRWGR